MMNRRIDLTGREKMVQTIEAKRAYDRAYYEDNKVEIRAKYKRNRAVLLQRYRPTAQLYLQTEAGKKTKLANAHRMMAKYPEKYKARYTLRNAVRLGHVIKGVCEVCGIAKVESHHDDYSKPLEVRWFCHQHHCELEERWAQIN